MVTKSHAGITFECRGSIRHMRDFDVIARVGEAVANGRAACLGLRPSFTSVELLDSVPLFCSTTGRSATGNSAVGGSKLEVTE